MECVICSEDITATTGRTVLGCGHEFHAICVARWFCRQEGASSCPCCRKEVGQYDDIVAAADHEDEEDEDEDEDESIISVEFYWQRGTTGVWNRVFRETETNCEWDPAVEPGGVPEELVEGAVSLQKIWRGHVARRNLAVGALLSLKMLAMPTSAA